MTILIGMWKFLHHPWRQGANCHTAQQLTIDLLNDHPQNYDVVFFATLPEDLKFPTSHHSVSPSGSLSLFDISNGGVRRPKPEPIISILFSIFGHFLDDYSKFCVEPSFALHLEKKISKIKLKFDKLKQLETKAYSLLRILLFCCSKLYLKVKTISIFFSYKYSDLAIWWRSEVPQHFWISDGIFFVGVWHLQCQPFGIELLF